MSNNQSIQILRSTRDVINASNSNLLDGQPLYNMTDNFLSIGGGADNKVSKEPIACKQIYEPNRGGDTGVNSTTYPYLYRIYRRPQDAVGALDIYSYGRLRIESSKIYTTCAAQIGQDLKVMTDLNVVGNTDLDGTLNVDGKLTINNDLSVSNNTIINATLSGYGRVGLSYTDTDDSGDRFTLETDSSHVGIRKTLYVAADANIGVGSPLKVNSNGVTIDSNLHINNETIIYSNGRINSTARLGAITGGDYALITNSSNVTINVPQVNNSSLSVSDSTTINQYGIYATGTVTTNLFAGDNLAIGYNEGLDNCLSVGGNYFEVSCDNAFFYKKITSNSLETTLVSSTKVNVSEEVMSQNLYVGVNDTLSWSTMFGTTSNSGTFTLHGKINFNASESYIDATKYTGDSNSVNKIQFAVNSDEIGQNSHIIRFYTE